MKPEVLAALWGAIIAGGFALLGTWLAQKNAREQRRVDAIGRDVEWLRSTLLHAFRESFYYLNKLAISARGAGTDNDHVRQHASEVLRNLLILQTFQISDLESNLIDELREVLSREIHDPSAKSSGTKIASAAQDASNKLASMLKRLRSAGDLPRLEDAT